MKPLEWFTSRIGQCVYRKNSICSCNRCERNAKEGVLIHCLGQAEYMHMVQEEGVVYQDKPFV